MTFEQMEVPVVPGQMVGPVIAPQAAEPVSYERLALVTGRHNWWRPFLGTIVLLGLTVAAMVPIFGVVDITGAFLDVPRDADDWPLFGDIPDTAFLLLLSAVPLPALALTARWVQKRRWGTLSSVVGHLRWSWLRTCLALAAAPIAVLLAVSFLMDPLDDSAWVGWGTFLTGLAVVVCLVPFQAAAEEYVCRGWLLQATGCFVRSPLLVLIPQAVLFAAAHGLGTPWGFASLVIFGLCTGWLTIRTGGLEAALGLHITTNVLGLGAAAAYTGGLASDETAADMPWPMFLLDTTLTITFTALILHLANRRNLTTHFTPPPTERTVADGINRPLV
ncbi:CPBP family intramembrane glutamic endopeptidase [Kribbella sp. NPDC023855]|uniref:CPBP family intramembrane glutamic endopeptidase n=1 Tax=Kribbella sp. NPDC023855 TaxID=3154698 RepID=UPI0033F3AA77